MVIKNHCNNKGDGFLVNSDFNTFYGNHAANNGNKNYEDSGTSNVWINNH
jgi:hypothetical protein